MLASCVHVRLQPFWPGENSWICAPPYQSVHVQVWPRWVLSATKSSAQNCAARSFCVSAFRCHATSPAVRRDLAACIATALSPSLRATARSRRSPHRPWAADHARSPAALCRPTRTGPHGALARFVGRPPLPTLPRRARAVAAVWGASLGRLRARRRGAACIRAGMWSARCPATLLRRIHRARASPPYTARRPDLPR